MVKKICGIYCIENIINHKKYIGQSVDIMTRWRTHKNELKNGTHRNDHLQNSWDDYGTDVFVFYIIEECPIGQLNDKEQYYIALYKTINRDYGYNLDTGGGCGRGMSAEARAKMRENHADCNGANNSFYGKKHTQDSIERMKQSTVFTDEYRKLLSKHHPDVSGDKNPRSQKVYCFELDMYFNTIQSAADYVCVDRDTIGRNLNGTFNHAGHHPTTGEPLHWIRIPNTQQNN